MKDALPLPACIDELARQHPDRPFVEALPTAQHGCSARKVSLGQLATAIDEAAWWMSDTLPDPTIAENNVVAFASTPQDLRYFILMVAAAKTGRLVREHVS